jgi:hypothetical protein
MRVYREVVYSMDMILGITLELGRRGALYRKDYDVCDASYSIYLDNRKCSRLFMANKRTHELYKIVRDEWIANEAIKAKKAARLAKLRATLAAKKAAKGN